MTDPNYTAMCDKLDALIAFQLGWPHGKTIKPEHSFDDSFGFDSLDEIELVEGVEDEWNISIPDEAFAGGAIDTVAQARQYLWDRIKDRYDPAHQPPPVAAPIDADKAS